VNRSVRYTASSRPMHSRRMAMRSPSCAGTRLSDGIQLPPGLQMSLQFAPALPPNFRPAALPPVMAAVASSLCPWLYMRAMG
jgi:hypothetical protein